MSKKLNEDKFQARANRKGLAVKGYDPVAYFTVGKPTKGSPDVTYQWSDIEWRFSSAEHRDLLREQERRRRHRRLISAVGRIG